MRFAKLPVLLVTALAWPSLASALPPSVLQGDKFHITEAERLACHDDAVHLCLNTYPDEDLLLACMKENREQLSQTCRTTFDSGLKRRHLSIN